MICFSHWNAAFDGVLTTPDYISLCYHATQLHLVLPNHIFQFISSCVTVYRFWLPSLYGLHSPRCVMSKKAVELNYSLTHSCYSAYVNNSGCGFAMSCDIVMPYISHVGTPEQQEKFLPAMTEGKCIGALGMTEPAAGRYVTTIHCIVRFHYRVHSVHTPSQWETMLLCNIVPHWLGACTKWSLHCNTMNFLQDSHKRHPIACLWTMS